MNVLTRFKLDWKPLDREHIEVTYIGHFDENFSEVETALNHAGLYAERRTYDRLHNKTTTIYKRTKKVA